MLFFQCPVRLSCLIDFLFRIASRRAPTRPLCGNTFPSGPMELCSRKKRYLGEMYTMKTNTPCNGNMICETIATGNNAGLLLFIFSSNNRRTLAGIHVTKNVPTYHSACLATWRDRSSWDVLDDVRLRLLLLATYTSIDGPEF